MRVAYLRTSRSRGVFLGAARREEARRPVSLASSSIAKDMLLELLRRGKVSYAEEWRFWDAGPDLVHEDGTLPIRLFTCDPEGRSGDFEEFIETNGQPDVVWIEGRGCPPHIAQVLRSCAASFKLVYSKDHHPWKIKCLNEYQLCLVDEEWQQKRVARDYPDVPCELWDKYIECDATFMPLTRDKDFDVCYTASLRQRKNHELLFHAMHRLGSPSLRCVCVGPDPEGRKTYLENLAGDLGIDVTFAGEVPREAVNEYLNRSRFSVICSKVDSAPRAMIESLAAGVPVLASSELKAGTRYLADPGSRGGIVRAPDDFHDGLAEMAERWTSFEARQLFLDRFSRDQTVDSLLALLRSAEGRRRA